MKLSEKLISRYRAAVMHIGDDFGLAEPYDFYSEETNLVSVKSVIFENGDDTFVIPYAYFLKCGYLFFCIGNTIYTCNSNFHIAFSIEEIVLLLYLVFEQHYIFNL